MFKTHYLLKKNSIKNFVFLYGKTFTTSADYPWLNTYLKDSIQKLSKINLKTNQTNIIQSINKIDSHSMILCDDFSGRKYSSLLGVMNRVLNTKEKSAVQNLLHKNTQTEIKEDEYFASTKENLKKSKGNIEKNMLKKDLKPRGALVICQKFEFSTHFYRICRKLDCQNRLRLVRLGTSLHTVSPTVDIDSKYSDTDEQEEKQKEEYNLGNVNLINTTEWKNIDILFITPQMLEYISSQKDSFDYFDINPEIILVDDFDYILNSSKYDIRKPLTKFFNRDSKFGLENLAHRKLVLSSSTLQTTAPVFRNNYDEEISKAEDFYKSYLNEVDPDLKNKLDIVKSPNFMNFEFYTKGIKINLKSFDEDKGNFEKKLKFLFSLINSSNSKSMIICCDDQNIHQIKESLKKKKLNFVSVDESKENIINYILEDRIGQRLLSVMNYNKYEYNILLITPIFLKSVNVVKLSHLILFDYPSEYRDLLRLLSKFANKGEEFNDNICHILLDKSQTENFSSVLEKFKASE